MRIKMNVKSLIRDRVERYRDKTFLFYRDQKYTYEELDRITDHVANAFRSIGVTKGDKVAIMLPNCPEFLFIWFGLAKIGAVEVLINIQLKGPFLKHQIEIGDSKAAVIGTYYLESFLPILDELPDLRTVIFLPHDKAVKSPEGPNYYIYSDWVLSHRETPPPEVDIEDCAPISIMFTSGTTGPSKGVLNSHKAYIRCGEDCAKTTGLTDEDRCYFVLPLYHGNPQMMAVMSALWVGGSLVISERFSASRFFQEAKQFGATYFTYVGTILAILSKLPEKPDDSENPLRLCFGGGAPENEWKIMQDRFRIKVYEAYGMIEAGCVTTINRDDKERFGSVGIPRDCFDVKVMNQRDEEVAIGEVGEIVVRPRETSVMFDGYYNMTDRTVESLRNLWFHTGDKAKKDKDGFFYFEGRVKHTIRRKGENISSEAIENIINACPKVLESAVVGVPDEIAKEEIKAYIIARPAVDLSPVEVIEWCRGGLPDFMVPRYIEFRDHFDKTGSEKIQKYKLQEEGIGKAWDRLEVDKDQGKD
jgi:crotonobetaine/carnitine-CoA ligase